MDILGYGGVNKMMKILEDLIHAGLGLTQVTREHVEKIFNELKKKGEVFEQDREYFVKKTLDRLEKTGKDIKEKVQETISPSTKKIDELNRKIDTLVKDINELKKKKG
jgi:polyhydroxyalkanoate synthesis regulator phasin